MGIALLFLFIFLLHRLVINRVLPWYYDYDQNISEKEKRSIRRIIFSILFLGLVIGLLILLRFDYPLFMKGEFELRISNLFEGILILQVARLLDKTLSRLLSTSYQKSHPNDLPHQSINTKKTAGKTMQYIVYTVALLYGICLLYTSPSPRDATLSRMPSSA